MAEKIAKFYVMSIILVRSIPVLKKWSWKPTDFACEMTQKIDKFYVISSISIRSILMTTDVSEKPFNICTFQSYTEQSEGG